MFIYLFKISNFNKSINYFKKIVIWSIMLQRQIPHKLCIKTINYLKITLIYPQIQRPRNWNIILSVTYFKSLPIPVLIIFGLVFLFEIYSISSEAKKLSTFFLFLIFIYFLLTLKSESTWFYFFNLWLPLNSLLFKYIIYFFSLN